MPLEVARGQLDAGEDELHAEDEAGEVEDDGIEALLGAALHVVRQHDVCDQLHNDEEGRACAARANSRIFKRFNEVGRVRRKGHSSQERYH